MTDTSCGIDNRSLEERQLTLCDSPLIPRVLLEGHEVARMRGTYGSTVDYFKHFAASAFTAWLMLQQPLRFLLPCILPGTRQENLSHLDSL